MYDSFFQLIQEIFLTCIWYITSGIKDFFLRLFHRDHTFDQADIIYQGEFARCQKCPVTLYELRPRTLRRAAKVAAFLLLGLFSLSHADSFVGSQRDTAFYVDSVYLLKIAVTQADCSLANPCTVQIASEGGSGTVLKNLYASVGDTIRAPYNFPLGQFKAGATRAVLYFYGADGKAKDIWMIGLAYKDSKPPLGVRRPTVGFRAPRMKWEGQINGRIFR